MSSSQDGYISMSASSSKAANLPGTLPQSSAQRTQALTRLSSVTESAPAAGNRYPPSSNEYTGAFAPISQGISYSVPSSQTFDTFSYESTNQSYPSYPITSSGLSYPTFDSKTSRTSSARRASSDSFNPRGSTSVHQYAPTGPTASSSSSSSTTPSEPSQQVIPRPHTSSGLSMSSTAAHSSVNFSPTSRATANVYRAYDPTQKYHLPNNSFSDPDARPAAGSKSGRGANFAPRGSTTSSTVDLLKNSPSSSSRSLSLSNIHDESTFHHTISSPSLSALPLSTTTPDPAFSSAASHYFSNNYLTADLHQHYYSEPSSRHPQPITHTALDQHDSTSGSSMSYTQHHHDSSYGQEPQLYMRAPYSSTQSAAIASWNLAPGESPYNRGYGAVPSTSFVVERQQSWGLPPIGSDDQTPRIMAPVPRYGSYDESMSSVSGVAVASGIPVPMLSSPRLGSSHRRESTASDRSAASDEERRESTTPFISKLSHLLSSEEHCHLIRWNDDGTKFTFAHSSPELLEVFTRIFRHGNIHSFVRQLNIYSFTRLSTLDLVEALPLREDPGRASEFHGFMHPLFFRNTPNRVCDLTRIKPKLSKKSAVASKVNAAAAAALQGVGDRRRGSIGGPGSTPRNNLAPYAYHPPSTFEQHNRGY